MPKMGLDAAVVAHTARMWIICTGIVLLIIPIEVFTSAAVEDALVTFGFCYIVLMTLMGGRRLGGRTGSNERGGGPQHSHNAKATAQERHLDRRDRVRNRARRRLRSGKMSAWVLGPDRNDMQLPATQRSNIVLAVVVLGALWVGVGLGRVDIVTPAVATVIVVIVFGYVLTHRGRHSKPEPEHSRIL